MMASCGPLVNTCLSGSRVMTIVLWFPPNGRRGGNAGQRGKQRPHAIQREILQFLLCVCRAAEDQLSGGYTARIETSDKRGHGSGRHDRAGVVHVVYSLTHRL